MIWWKKANDVTCVMKKCFNKEKLLMTKGDNGKFKTSAKWWIFENDYVDNDVKVRHYCHITGKCRGSAHGDCNINLELNRKFPVVFHNLKISFSSIMQQLGKFDLKINVITNGNRYFDSNRSLKYK